MCGQGSCESASQLQAVQAKDAEGKAAPVADTDNKTGQHTSTTMQDAPGHALEQSQPAASAAAGEDTSAGPQPAEVPLSGNGMQPEGASVKRNVRKRVVEAGVFSHLWSSYPSQSRSRTRMTTSNWCLMAMRSTLLYRLCRCSSQHPCRYDVQRFLACQGLPVKVAV